MKTAVEWLEEQYTKQITFLHREDFEQAKEMEKKQCYSEEEVLDIIKKLHIEIGFQFTNEIKEWCLKQFKNK
jgi:hypothetical protein